MLTVPITMRLDLNVKRIIICISVWISVALRLDLKAMRTSTPREPGFILWFLSNQNSWK